MDKPLVCPHCGRALLALDHKLQRYETEIATLKERLAERKPRSRDLVAHRDGQLFHRATCKWARIVARSTRVRFASREEAIKAGLKPCSSCGS